MRRSRRRLHRPKAAPARGTPDRRGADNRPVPDPCDDALERHHRLVRGLMRPAAWPQPFDGAAEVIETHLSSVLLAGGWALKLKKPLALDFVDFSSRERRHHFCAEELRLNRRTAAHWYVDVLPVLGAPDAPRLGRADDAADAAAALDWALRMRRFDSDAAFDRLAAAGRLGEAQVDALAQAVAAFHAALPPSPAAWGDPHDTRRIALDTLATLAALGVEPQAVAALRDWSVDAHATLASRLERRRARGRVREGHGDLHLGNIAWLDGAPVLFDALEFDPRLRHVDTMSDAAFTFMDLLDHALPALGWRFLSAYLELGGDHDALPTVRAFAVHRALVRAKVAAIRAAQPDAGAAVRAAATAAAQRHIALASSLAHPAPPRLVLTTGVSGSGKSTVAQLLVHALGAVCVRSDVERKRLHGLAPTERVDPARLYHARATVRTYARLAEVARLALEGGIAVVVDAAFLRRDERDAMRRLAAACGARCVTVECTAPDAVLLQRLARRAAQGRDASDATAPVLTLQQRVREPLAADEAAVVLDTDVDLPALAARVQAMVAGWPVR